MFSIQSAMLVVLGFSVAGLLISLCAPFYARRAARLAIASLKKNMPTSTEEIQAEQDRIRAQYAIEIHDLQTKLSSLSLKAAHQLVEMNKRDAKIKLQEKDITHFKAINEEHQNARRVLEATIRDRIPKIEQRLSEATKLLFERDHEITALSQSTQKQTIALQEAIQINAQQRAEIENLNLKLSRRLQRTRDTPLDKGLEIENALRTENDALRVRLREQAQTLSHLQKKLADASNSEEGKDTETEMSKLSRILAEAEKAFQATQSKDISEPSLEEVLQKQIIELKAQNDEQFSLIQVLKAEMENRDGNLTEHSKASRAEKKQMSFDPGSQMVATSWKSEASSMTVRRPSLTELVNAPKSVNSTWTEFGSFHPSLGQNDQILKEELERKDPLNHNEKKMKEETQEEKTKSASKTGLLQRITNLEKNLT